jgi:hypothetical protein
MLYEGTANLSMEQTRVTVEDVLELARQLSPLEKVRLLEEVIPDLESPLASLEDGKRPLLSAYGACADLGLAPSAQEIEVTRQELFGDFPRTDLA